MSFSKAGFWLELRLDTELFKENLFAVLLLSFENFGDA